MNRRRNKMWLGQQLPLREPQRVQLIFNVDNIENEINTLSAVIGESHDKADSNSDNTLVKDVSEDSNRTLLLNGIDKLMKEVMMFLFPYTKTPLTTRYVTDNPNEVEAYVIELTFDYERSEVQVMYLQSYIKDFVIKRYMYDWLSYTMVPGQRVSDVSMQIRKMLEESEFAKNKVLESLAQPMEIKNHRVSVAQW